MQSIQTPKRSGQKVKRSKRLQVGDKSVYNTDTHRHTHRDTQREGERGRERGRERQREGGRERESYE